MRLCVVADLHGMLPPVIPECDVLAIAGDIAPDGPFHKTWGDPQYASLYQREWLGDCYAAWEKLVPAKYIIATPGNHDWYQVMPDNCRTQLYIDQLVEIDDIQFWLTPWISPVGAWNYMLPRGQRKERFAMIPYKVDVLISHSPAFNVLDKTYAMEPAGCPELRAAICAKKPRHAFFGHIHEGCRAGIDAMLGETQMHHASVMYKNPPRVIEILPAYQESVELRVDNNAEV